VSVDNILKKRLGLVISNHNPKQLQLNFIALLKVNERKHEMKVFVLQIQHKTHAMNILGLDICMNEPKRSRKNDMTFDISHVFNFANSTSYPPLAMSSPHLGLISATIRNQKN